MTKAGSSDVLLAHATCGPVGANIADGALCRIAQVGSMRSGVSLPGGLASTAVGSGVLRGGVLGDITNVPSGAIPGGVKSLKPPKVSPVTCHTEEAGMQQDVSLHQAISAVQFASETIAQHRQSRCTDPSITASFDIAWKAQLSEALQKLRTSSRPVHDVLKDAPQNWFGNDGNLAYFKESDLTILVKMFQSKVREPKIIGEQASDVIMSTPRCSDGDIDVVNAGDPQFVTEYAPDIYGMMSREAYLIGFLAKPDYLDAQVDINAKMRAILIDWLVEVHMKYKLKTETLFLAVNLIDRFLSKRGITRKKLQLVGVTGMLIAAKFEEIYPPEVRDFVYITDKAYTKEEILQMEVFMLTVLEFSINCPTVCHFFERYHRVNRCNEQHRHLLQYVLELTLPDFKMLRYTPSHLAAAATLLSNKVLKQQPAWPAAMVRHTQQTDQDVKACAKEMCGLLDAAEKSPLQAVRKKFSQEKFSRVGKMTF